MGLAVLAGSTLLHLGPASSNDGLSHVLVVDLDLTVFTVARSDVVDLEGDDTAQKLGKGHIDSHRNAIRCQQGTSGWKRAEKAKVTKQGTSVRGDSKSIPFCAETPCFPNQRAEQKRKRRNKLSDRANNAQ